jgi:hypothetical protein
MPITVPQIEARDRPHQPLVDLLRVELFGARNK